MGEFSKCSVSGAQSAPSLCEHPDDVVAAGAECSQLEHYWLIEQPKGRFVERYCAGEIGIALRKREIWSVPRATKQDGFVWKALPFGAGAGKDQRCIQLIDVGINSDESLMLSNDVEVVQGVEKRVPSFVRFQRFDRGDFGIGEPLFLFDIGQFAVQPALKLVDRKFRVSIRIYAVAPRETGSDHIESASAGVDNHSGLDIDKRIERNPFMRYDKFVRGIRIRLEPERVWVVHHPSNEAILEDWDLGYGPIDAGLSV